MNSLTPAIRFRVSPVLFASLVFVLLSNGASAQERPPVTAPNARAVVGAPNGLPPSVDRLEAMTKQVASLLRCPVCQGLSVWDSPATMAVNMKHGVRELLAAGYSEEQVLRYFEHSYGEFVLLAPSRSGIALVVWLLPVLLLMAGGVTVWRLTSRASAAAGARVEPGALPVDRDLARYVMAVRAGARQTGRPVMPPAQTDWLPVIIVLLSGGGIGAALARASRKRARVIAPSAQPLALRDLLATRDALIDRLREIGTPASTGGRDHFARERHELEIEAAGVVRAIEKEAKRLGVVDPRSLASSRRRIPVK